MPLCCLLPDPIEVSHQPIGMPLRVSLAVLLARQTLQVRRVIVGFVVVGVPGGIGVREAVFTSLAGSIIGTPMAVSLALMSRVVFIAVDLSGALISSIISRLNSSAKS